MILLFLFVLSLSQKRGAVDLLRENFTPLSQWRLLQESGDPFREGLGGSGVALGFLKK